MKKDLLRGVGALAFLLWIGSSAEARYAPAPDWTSRVQGIPTPANAGSAPALILLDETAEEIDAQGSATVRHRLAVRILTVEGKTWAHMALGYLQGSDRVKLTDAWLIRNGKEVKNPDYNDWIDLSSDPYGSLYSDIRTKQFSRSDAVVGDVFVAETELVGPLLVANASHAWSWGGLPVVEQTYRLKLPAGFVSHASLHGESLPVAQASQDPRETVWTLRDQPYVLPELYSPRADPTQAVLLLAIEPSSAVPGFRPMVARRWEDVANWANSLNQGQCDTNLQLAEKARQLTAGCTTPLAKIRALGTYVQNLRYVALYEGLARGLGYQPHKASLVFGQGYGDCKDKANLLCAMLHEVGVEADLAVARAGDDRDVWDDFPSVTQFDHAIAAIRVDDQITLPAVVESKNGGRWLFFDPTSEHTCVGDLPWYVQGTSVFVLKLGSKDLIQLPKLAPREGYLATRRLALKLAPDGSCAGHASISCRGQAGAEMRRAMFDATTEESLRKFAMSALGDSTRGANLTGVLRQDDQESGVCGVAFEFSKANYLQFLKNSLVVAKGDVLGRGAVPALPAVDRHQPVKLSPIAFDDELEFVLPENMQPEEMPKAISLTSPYGSYQREFKVEGKSIKLTRKLEIKQMMVPVSEYPALRKFLSDLSKADRASMLLRTKA
jgi:transglutaminase-like putative cysteine protease